LAWGVKDDVEAEEGDRSCAVGGDADPFSPAQFELLTYAVSRSCTSIYVLAAVTSKTSSVLISGKAVVAEFHTILCASLLGVIFMVTHASCHQLSWLEALLAQLSVMTGLLGPLATSRKQCNSAGGCSGWEMAPKSGGTRDSRAQLASLQRICVAAQD